MALVARSSMEATTMAAHERAASKHLAIGILLGPIAGPLACALPNQIFSIKAVAQASSGAE